MLMPAAVLVLVILGSIAVDFAIVYLGQRQLENAVAGMANDLATEALPESELYGSVGAGGIDMAEVERRIAAVEGDPPSGLRQLQLESHVEERRITISGQATVDFVFARAIPGVKHQTSVRATTRATAIDR